MGSRKKWDLTEESFRGLLEFLDPGTGRGAEQYEKVRQKLTRFFEWKGCIPGDELADETMDRVARKLEAGLEIPPRNPYLYIHGVAVNVIREHWREAQTLAAAPVPPSAQTHERDSATEEHNERRMDCLEDCIGSLGAASRELLTAYHLGGRRGLAASINVPPAALRLRVFRIRRRLERCVSACLARKEPGNNMRLDTIK